MRKSYIPHTLITEESEKERYVEYQRDRFATAALTGLLSLGRQGYKNLEAETAKQAYLFADAMLKAREGK